MPVSTHLFRDYSFGGTVNSRICQKFPQLDWLVSVPLHCERCNIKGWDWGKKKAYLAWVSPSCRSCTPSQRPSTRSALSPYRQPCTPGSAPGQSKRIRWKGGKAETVHLLFHLDTNLDRHLHTFLLWLKVGNLQFCSLANNVSSCQARWPLWRHRCSLQRSLEHTPHQGPSSRHRSNLQPEPSDISLGRLSWNFIWHSAHHHLGFFLPGQHNWSVVASSGCNGTTARSRRGQFNL